MDKVLKDIKQALQLAGLRDGMTLSFHHHLRNGDFVLNQVLAAADQLGFRDLHVNASSLFDIHAPLIELIRRGVVYLPDRRWWGLPGHSGLIEGPHA